MMISLKRGFNHKIYIKYNSCTGKICFKFNDKRAVNENVSTRNYEIDIFPLEQSLKLRPSKYKVCICVQ